MDKKFDYNPCKTCRHQKRFETELRRFEKGKGEKRYTGICFRKEEVSLTHDCWSCPHHWAADVEEAPEADNEDFS